MASCYRIDEILEEERYQCHSLLTNLSPESTYFVTPKVNISLHEELIGQTLKFRTAPSLNSSNNFNFINGGDLAWSESGIALLSNATFHEPLFAIIGGDVGS